MDTVIHDNALSGSPIMSYGEPPRTGRALKLLAVLAGSFVVLGMILLLVGWWGMSLPLPEKTLVVMVAWPSANVGATLPDVWRQARTVNDPLPTLMGYARDSKTGEPAPFAVEFPSLFSAATYRDGSWELVSPSELTVKGHMGLAQTFGPLYRLPWSQALTLTVYAQELLDAQDVANDLPPTISGPVVDRVWYTDFLVQGRPSGLDNQENFIELSEDAAKNVSSYASLQGLLWPIPSSGVLRWQKMATGTRLEIESDGNQKALVALGLALANGQYGTKDALLPDQTPYKIITPPTTASGTADYVFFKQQDVYTSIAEQTAEINCQGDDISVLDARASANVCSWLGVCWERPGQVKLFAKNGKLTVCF